MGRALADARGLSSLVLGLFLTAAVFLAAEAYLDITRVIQARTQLDQALTLALQSAVARGNALQAVGGAGAPAVVWNPPAAQSAAEQALTTAFPVQVAQSGLAPSGGWATFVPVGSTPPDWSGPLTLSAFQTGNTAGPVTLYQTHETAGGPYVAAALSVPLTLRFYGIPITVSLQTARLALVYGYNGQQFQEFP